MTFDDWCATHGVYLNDDDDAAKAAKAMAREAWDAAVAAERGRCAAWLEREGRHDMAYALRTAMHCGPNHAVSSAQRESA